MLHLDPERLAALADDEPTAAEVVHLAECVECARERDAHRALHAMAARERATVVQPPLSDWSSLRAQLREEGLLSTAGDMHVSRNVGSMGARWRPWLNAAAAVLLVLGGGAVGRWSAYAGQRGATQGSSSQVANAQRSSGATLAANSPSTDTTLTFHSMEEALATLRVAERTYRSAVSYIAAQDTSADTQVSPEQFRARLAALDRMSGAALAAVNEAPHDPVINQYYLSTVSARQATLRQLDRALPSGVKLVSY